MRKYVKKFFLGLFFLMLPQSNRPDVIFFDLNGTLLQNDEAKMKACLGTKNIVLELLIFHYQHLLKYYKFGSLVEFKQHLLEIFFRGLNAIEYELPAQCLVDYEIYSEDGVTPLPHFLRDVMLGHISYDTAKFLRDLMLQTKQYVEKGDGKEPLFTSNELRIFLNMFELTINPDIFNKSQVVSPLLATLKKCAEQVDEDGNRKHVCIILSNWTKDGVPKFKKRFKDSIMPYIDDCVFSCDGYGAKPARSIYMRCYDLVKIKFPGQLRRPWFFIDDQQVNRDGFEHFVDTVCLPIKLFCIHPKNALALLQRHRVI